MRRRLELAHRPAALQAAGTDPGAATAEHACLDTAISQPVLQQLAICGFTSKPIDARASQLRTDLVAVTCVTSAGRGLV
jgi:hypothetical protein